MFKRLFCIFYSFFYCTANAQEVQLIEKLKAKDESLLENASVRDAEIKAEIPGSEEDVERRVEAVVNSRFVEAPVVEVKAEEEPV